MVLHPFGNSSCSGTQSGQVAAWHAVETRQKQAASQWVLITQPDHAQLAADLAARLQFSLFPQLDSDLVRAIALHDAGWAEFDALTQNAPFTPRLNDRGKPLSFLEASPAEFVLAWTGSIATAEQAGAAGGFIVSRHFCRLAEARLNAGIDNEEDTSRLRYFLQHETRRQERLSTGTDCPLAKLDLLTNLLQFCDLLSLYLCCGATESVQFPQEFDGVTVTVHRDADMFRFEPAIFGPGTSLGVSGMLYASEGVPTSRCLAFLLR